MNRKQHESESGEKITKTISKSRMRVTRKERFEFDYFTIHKDNVVFNEKKEYDLCYLVPKRNGVLILSIMEGKLVLVRQYRHAIKSAILELPGGIIDDGETPQKAAIRELEEETGYRAGRIVHLGTYYVSSSFSSAHTHIFFADKLAKGCINREPSELIAIERYVPQEVLSLLMSDQIVDSRTPLSILLAQRKGLI